MTNSGFGIVYLLTGMQHAARMVVSIYSLRKWYDGPVTVFTTREESHTIGELCANEPALRVRHEKFQEVNCGDTSSYVTKVSLLKDGPYQATLYLDADTLVAGEIGELIDAARDAPLTVTAIGRDTTQTPWFARLLRDEWRPFQQANGNTFRLNRLLQIAETVPQHTINLGVVAAQRGAPMLREWLALAQGASNLTIPDEMALQLLLPRCEYAILGQEYNCWPFYFPDVDDVRIWHFVGVSHLRRGRSVDVWLPAYQACYSADLVRITQWSKVDPT